MDSIFDKLTTLVNAQLNDFLGRNPKSPLARIKLDADEVEKNPRRTVQSIRKRLDEALAYEDELQAKIETLTQEAMLLDEQTDAMVKSGDEFGARRVLGQLNMKQQQLSIAQSELRDHRLLSQHLMQEMTTLEMALNNQQQERSEPSASNKTTRIPIEGQDFPNVSSHYTPEKSVFNTVTDKLNETRSSLENLLNNSPVPNPPDVSKQFEKFDIVDEVPDPRTPKSKKTDHADMNQRLSRLSKPDED